MKLDENVCRGSLIIHKGEKLIVVAPLRVMQPTTAGKFNFSLVDGWKTCRAIAVDGGVDYIVDGKGLARTEDVEAFFPGAVYPLPDYIK